jgi:glycerophosphoryl diester phosphodiesterase
VVARRRSALGRTLRIGHKGAAALAPENTLPSLERALEIGVDLVEFDVLDLADGTLVLAHSDDLHEVSHGTAAGRVRTKSLAELHAASPATPTLDAALAFLAERAPEVGIHLDLKWFGYEEPAVEALQRHGAVERTLVSSFHPHSLRRVGELEPGLTLGLTYPFDRRQLSRRRVLAPVVLGALVAMRRALPRKIDRLLDAAGATVATLHWGVVSQAAVERCHARGASVVAWTVDDPAVARRMEALGVDGIVSNDPRMLLATLSA